MKCKATKVDGKLQNPQVSQTVPGLTSKSEFFVFLSLVCQQNRKMVKEPIQL